MKPTDIVDKQILRTDIPKVSPGDEVKVHVRVVESGKERVQIFQGNVISVYGSGVAESYTVRKLSYGVGVERTFPIHSPAVAKLEVIKRGDVRRAKLNYLRERTGRSAKVRELREDQ
ncbi:MAG: 50S ribosomal protein L19 [Actinomycetota bacterium]|nr:50S ribosomal protein L19 [Actinomycetota bacterium]